MDAPIDKHLDRDVIGVRAKLTKAGDGLSQSMAVDPRILHIGDEVMVLCRARITQCASAPHYPQDLHGPLDYVYTLQASTMLLTDTAQNAKLLAAMEKRIDAAHEIEGQRSITDELDPDEPGDWDER